MFVVARSLFLFLILFFSCLKGPECSLEEIAGSTVRIAAPFIIAAGLSSVGAPSVVTAIPIATGADYALGDDFDRTTKACCGCILGKKARRLVMFMLSQLVR